MISLNRKKIFFSKARWQDTQSCIGYGLERGKVVGPKSTWRRIVMKELEELGLDLPQVDCVSAEGVRDAREVRESERCPYMSLAETGNGL